MSLLLPPGSVAIRAADILGTKCYWVLSSSAHGASAWHADIKFVGGKTWIEVESQANSWEILHVVDPSEWFILDCVCTPCEGPS
jgi:hypothetical protein